MHFERGRTHLRALVLDLQILSLQIHFLNGILHILIAKELKSWKSFVERNLAFGRSK